MANRLSLVGGGREAEQGRKHGRSRSAEHLHLWENTLLLDINSLSTWHVPRRKVVCGVIQYAEHRKRERARETLQRGKELGSPRARCVNRTAPWVRSRERERADQLHTYPSITYNVPGGGIILHSPAFPAMGSTTSSIYRRKLLNSCSVGLNTGHVVSAIAVHGVTH